MTHPVQAANGVSRESGPLQPLSAYGRQKLQCESYLRKWYAAWNSAPALSPLKRVTILRPFSVYGPWPRPDMAPYLFLDGIYRRTPVDMVDAPVLRDFTHIDDVVRAMSAAAGLLADGAPRAALAGEVVVVNAGSGQPRPLCALFDLIATALGRPAGSAAALLRGTALGPEEARATHADGGEARRLLGWEARVPWEDGVRGMFEWYVQHEAPAPFVVAVVATCDRPGLLRERALASIAAQRRRPDGVVVVDDSDDAACRHANRAAVAALGGAVGWIYRPNQRTKGACGAWNCGVLLAAALARAAGRRLDAAFVAVLDDDDEWDPAHLAACAARAAETGAQQVIAGLLRVEEGPGAGPPRKVAVPDPAELGPGRFYATNPGVQGSNLFVSAAGLLAAGLFAEHLGATTDRDLMARLAALGPAAHPVAALPQLHTAVHHAGAGPRLTTDRRRKRRSLEVFLRDHGPHMTAAERAGFLQRARVFGADLGRPRGSGGAGAWAG